MSKIAFQVAYDGPKLAEHGMDVYSLAPALLAFGDLIREANSLVNGNKAKVSVLVTEDFEHKCFNISFEILQTIFEQAKSLLSDDDVKSAKDILEWLGLLGGPAAAGLLTYLRLRKGRPIESVTQLESPAEGGNVAVKFQGDHNNVVVHQHVYRMGEDPKIRSAASRSLAPLESDGIDEMRSEKDGETILRIRKEEAADIRLSCVAHSGEEETFEPQIVTAHLKVFAPVFEEDAEGWRFDYGGKQIYANIAETQIAAEVLRRGYVGVGDVYRVRMEITEHKTKTGQYRNDYKILEVVEFLPATRERQLTLGLDTSQGDKPASS